MPEHDSFPTLRHRATDEAKRGPVSFGQLARVGAPLPAAEGAVEHHAASVAQRLVGVGEHLLVDHVGEARHEGLALSGALEGGSHLVGLDPHGRKFLGERDDPQGWLAMFEHFLTIWEPVDELHDDELFRLDTSQLCVSVPGPAQLGLEHT
jgi:hypothetical protein